MLELIKEKEVLGQTLKVYGTWEEPLFLAKDVAEWIEHSDVSMMLKKIDEDEKVTSNVCTLGGKQKSWFLTEDGLYEVLMQSRKLVAKAFKKEVKAILKEIRTTGSYTSQTQQHGEYSPLLQLLMNMEIQHKEMGHKLEATNQRIDSIRDVVSLDTKSWRSDTKPLIAKVAMDWGGIDFMSEVYTHIYSLLEDRASVNLNARLTNKRRRMAEEGVSKSKRNAVSTLDVIADDKKLIAIYVAIVKEVAISAGVSLPEESTQAEILPEEHPEKEPAVLVDFDALMGGI